MSFDVIKLRIENEVYETGKKNIENISIDFEKNLIEIEYEKSHEYPNRILFLNNVGSIDYRE